MVDFGRLLTAMITPFNEKGDVDFKTMDEMVEMLIETGTEGIVVSGTTGESPTLSHDEEFEIFKRVQKVCNGRVSVIAGTGSNSTKTSVDSTKKAEELGVDGAMVVVPYYNKPSQEGMYRHFNSIAKATNLPLILYNIPSRTGINMQPETTRRIVRDNKNVVAYKAASGDMVQIKKVVSENKDLLVYSGDDGLTLDILKNGGHGVISVASHVAGDEISAMINAYVQDNIDKADELNGLLADLFKILFITANPTPVKAALEMCWKSVGIPRLPLIEATELEKEQIRVVLNRLGKVEM